MLRPDPPGFVSRGVFARRTLEIRTLTDASHPSMSIALMRDETTQHMPARRPGVAATLPGAVVLLCLIVVGHTARAGALDNTGGATSADNVISWTGDAAPRHTLTSDAWSIIAWLREDPDQTPIDMTRTIIGLDDVALLGIDSSDHLTATLPTTVGAVTVNLPAFTPAHGATLASWTLVALTVERDQRQAISTITLLARGNDASAVVEASFVMPDDILVDVHDDAMFSFGGAPTSWLGARSVVVRDHGVNAVDVEALWQARSLTAPIVMDTLDDGGSMSGEYGAIWAAGLFNPTSPLDAGVSAQASLRNDLVTANNVVVLHRHAVTAPMSIMHVRPTIVGPASSFRHVDPYDADSPLGGFFLPRIDDSAGLVTPTSGVLGERAARFALEDSDQPLRVLSWSNSRAVSLSTAGGRTVAENHAQAYTVERRARQIGAVNIPIMLVDTRQFGVDSFEYGRFHIDGAVDPIYGGASAGQRAMYQRLWSGGGIVAPAAGASGASGGVLLRPGGSIQIGVHPEPGSELSADRPLLLECYALVSGVVPSVRLTRVKSPALNVPGSAIGPTTSWQTSTTSWTHEMTESDLRIDNDTLQLFGDVSALVSPGQLMIVQDDRPTYNSVNQVHNVSVANGQTTIDFVHSFDDIPATPQRGQGLTFTDARVERLRVRLPALAPDDPDTCRGLRIDNVGKGIVALYAMTYHVENACGEMHGPVGWGGAGYSTQIPAAFDGALERLFELTAPDVVIAMPADQLTEPVWWSNAIDTIRAGAPHADIILATTSEMTPTGWDHLAADEAFTTRANVFGVSLRAHPDLGDTFEMFASFGMRDAFHFSTHGNVLIARALLDELQTPGSDVLNETPTFVDELLDVIRGAGVDQSAGSTGVGASIRRILEGCPASR